MEVTNRFKEPDLVNSLPEELWTEVSNIVPEVANTIFQHHKRRLYTWTSPDGNTEIRLIVFFAAKDEEALYSQQKQDQELTVA